MESNAVVGSTAHKGKKRSFRFLDVYTKGEGLLRLRLYFSFILWSIITAAYLGLYELVLLNVEDSDTRDIIADYLTTAPGLARRHQLFLAATSANGSGDMASLSARRLLRNVTINGQLVPLQPREENGIGLISLSQGISLFPSPCPGTTSRSRYLYGAIRVQIRGLDLTARGRRTGVTVQAVGDTRTVDAYSQRTDFDRGKISVARLSGVDLHVSMVEWRRPSAWALHSVTPIYGTPWEGKLSASSGAFQPVGVTLDVRLMDLSAPTLAAAPELTGGWRLLVCFACAGLGGFMTFLIPFLLCILRINVLDNNGMPPPFYHHKLKYRGW